MQNAGVVGAGCAASGRVTALGHSRLSQPVLPAISCPLLPESDLIITRTQNDAKGHVLTHTMQQTVSSHSITLSAQ
jgi:hypothetical protein